MSKSISFLFVRNYGIVFGERGIRRSGDERERDEGREGKGQVRKGRTMKTTKAAKGYENAGQLQRLGIEPLDVPAKRVMSLDGQIGIPGVDLWEIELEHMRARSKGKARRGNEDGRQARLF